MKETSIVRENLMTKEGYTGYCGSNISSFEVGGCNNPRTQWKPELNQFKCPKCGWTSQFPSEFIERYKAKWNK